jgi:hypothetical protein
MATYHFEIKSGKKGSALTHAKYITRRGSFQLRDDLISEDFGNMPDWSHSDPYEFWRMANKYERANGSTYREYEIALPNELTDEQSSELARRIVAAMVGNKPYQCALHGPEAALGVVRNPHIHLMFSDRQPDGFKRPPQQFFSRYNANDPSKGGCRKESGGRPPGILRAEVLAKRELVAQIQNEMLAEVGSETRVDHRSNAARGLTRAPERHLGPSKIKQMSDEARAAYVAARD